MVIVEQINFFIVKEEEEEGNIGENKFKFENDISSLLLLLLQVFDPKVDKYSLSTIDNLKTKKKYLRS